VTRAGAWYAALATAIGYYSVITSSGIAWHWCLAYVLVVVGLWAEMRNGWASPLGLFLVLSMMRFGAPGLLLAASEIPVVPFFELLDLTEEDWRTAHGIALLGITSVVWGSLAGRRLHPARLFRGVERLGDEVSPDRLLWSAAGASAMGFVGLAAFVSLNSSGTATETVMGGTFRSEEITHGTGVLFHLSLGLIAGSVLLVMVLRSTGFGGAVSMLPAAVGGLAFFVLGGRARALSPIFGGLVGLADVRGDRGRRLRTLGVYLTGAIVVTAVAAVGQAYRGEYGIAALWELDSAFFVAYADYAIWLDVGQLHSLAAVQKLEPGALGLSVPFNMLGGLGRSLGLSGRSGGVFIIDSLVGEGGRKWGLHSTLIGDSYLSIGVGGIIAACFLFGAWLRALHRWRLAMPALTPLPVAVYAVAVVYSMRVCFESVEKVFEMVVVTAFLVACGVVGRVPVPGQTKRAALNA
jgi:hypothetical protein